MVAWYPGATLGSNWGRRGEGRSTFGNGSNTHFWGSRHRKNFQGRRWGSDRRGAIWRRKDEVISIFVDNINQMTSADTLRSLFAKYGEVCDVFISKKRRVNKANYFGFVKLRGPRNAFRAINHMKGRWVDDSKLYVKEARFQQKTTRSGNLKENDLPIKRRRDQTTGRTANRSSTLPENSIEPIGEDKFVKVQVNPSIMEELERSLIGECEEPRTVEVLSQTLTNQWTTITKVRDLGPYKFIVTFVGRVDMEFVLQMENSPLLQIFNNIYPWDIYQQGDTRRVWVDVMGIPPQVWSRDTCTSIANKFGVLVCCDANFDNPDSFVSCRLLIDTNIMSYIAEVLYLSIDEQCIGKSVFVREGSNMAVCCSKKTVQQKSLSWNQWDDTASVKSPTPAGSFRLERDCSVGASVDIVKETQVESERSSGTERTVTVVGNIQYSINEEKELISRKRNSKKNLIDSFSSPCSDDDLPPGYHKILNAKKFKRKSKPSACHNLSKSVSVQKKISKKSDCLSLSDELRGLSQAEPIEEWSEDDFESDECAEAEKSRKFGRLLGLGGGELLSYEELLR